LSYEKEAKRLLFLVEVGVYALDGAAGQRVRAAYDAA
jgi:hypothetical protein